jgi:hypothetical protein
LNPGFADFALLSLLLCTTILIRHGGRRMKHNPLYIEEGAQLVLGPTDFEHGLVQSQLHLRPKLVLVFHVSQQVHSHARSPSLDVQTRCFA